MTYITRNGKQEAENERGEKTEGPDQVRKLFENCGFDRSQTSTRQRAQTVNAVLSIPEGTDHIAMRNVSRAFAQERFGRNHEFLMALHSDTKQPQVHLVVKAQGFDMTLLKRTKADLQEWREGFAQNLRGYGVEAEATPRHAQGVIRKSLTQQMHHLSKTPKRSTIIEAKIDEVVREFGAGQPATARPWDLAIERRQRQTRHTYAKVEGDLRHSKDMASKGAAGQLAQFLSALRPINTERVETERKLAALFNADRTLQSDCRWQANTTHGGPNAAGAGDMGGREK